jgi:hypothetical protein
MTNGGLYFQLLWFIGAAQTDAANLTDANLDWKARVLKYDRQNWNGRSLPPACLTIGKGLGEILSQLPKTRPTVSEHHENGRPQPRLFHVEAVQARWNRRGFTPQLSVCVGRAGEDCRASATVGASGFGPQFKSRSRCLRTKCFGDLPAH